MEARRHRRKIATALLGVITLALTACGSSSSTPSGASGGSSPDLSGVTLTVGSQDAALPAIIEQSGTLKGTPYTVKFAVLDGPAQQLSALYSNNIDLGLSGDTGLIPEQANSKTNWTQSTAPLQIVAAWKNDKPTEPKAVTTISSSIKGTTRADLQGQTWAYNSGGANYIQYLLSYLKLGLTPSDFKPTEFPDGNTSGAAFSSGHTTIYSGGFAPVKSAVDSGKARILFTGDQVGNADLSVWIARRAVLDDPVKLRAVGNFLERVSKTWIWVAKHQAAVTEIYETSDSESADIAKYNANLDVAYFHPLNASFIAAEQSIANKLYAAGALSKKINVSAEFNPIFDNEITPKS